MRENDLFPGSFMKMTNTMFFFKLTMMNGKTYNSLLLLLLFLLFLGTHGECSKFLLKFDLSIPTTKQLYPKILCDYLSCCVDTPADAVALCTGVQVS